MIVEPVDGRVIGRREPDEQIGIGARIEASNELAKQRGRVLGCATPARHEVGQAYRCGFDHGHSSYTLEIERRELPSVDELLRVDQVASLPRPVAVSAARDALEQAREAISAGRDPGELADKVVELATRRLAPRIRRTINATGVILHTNLGRAPLAEAALKRVIDTSGYSNLEYDLLLGERGSRNDHLAPLLRVLTGAEDALVVNNNAAALLLALTAIADGKEVIVSRGEMIEIGDSFRIPDILATSGARLKEVGTTNRTRAADYEAAIGPDTALLLRVHQSNFRTIGFTERASVGELAAVAHRHGLPLLDDLGSGCLVPLADEPVVSESLSAGADLVTFSGDKLLGGPQAGIACGTNRLVARLRSHQLQRALRPCKLTLAALEGTLLLYLDPDRAASEVPTLRMMNEPIERVRERAERLAGSVGGDVVDTNARVGGGALPTLALPSAACAVELKLHAMLRRSDPAVVGVLRDNRTLLDCRAIAEDEVDLVIAAIQACRES